MNARDFIFPGVILALVVVIGIGLLLTHSDQPSLLPTNLASSTQAVATSTASATSTAPSAPVSPANSSAQAYGTVTLALGQAAAFADGVSIRPMRILEDSRCPAGVECIQAGTVKLSFTATAKGKTTAETISIGQSVKIDGDTVTLDTVAPQKTKGSFPEASVYRFTFTVAHG